MDHALDHAPFLIVGLGNPGSEYERTRHNVGFAVIDECERRWGPLSVQKKFHGELASSDQQGRRVLLLKPLTFMNRSGLSVGEAVSFYKLDPAKDLLVVSDDLDLPTGQLRLRLSGGSGGHNGLKSILAAIGTEGFARLRIGIGRSSTSPQADHVLNKWTKGEAGVYEQAIGRAADGIERILKEGIARAMNTVNQKGQDGA